MTDANVNEGARGAKTLYLDCQTGIAGDMFVAALLDLGGAPAEAAVRRMLASLSVGGFAVEVLRRKLSGIDCCDFDVVLDTAHENHDHDMAYLHGGEDHLREHEHEHEHCHCHGDDAETTRHHHGHASEHGCCHHHEHVDGHDADHYHAGSHAHDHAHEGPHAHHHHHHEHRGLADIMAIIDAAEMTPAARAFARKTFDILAHAEAKAHAVPLDEVHFHEVGAVDSIADVLSAAVLVDFLGIGRAVVPVLVDGHGSIRCQHGIIPVPVPATLNVCTAHGLPLAPGDVEGELVTPTGAALVAALGPAFELPTRYAVRAVGLGAGKRAYSRPSILRAMLIDELPQVVGGSHAGGQDGLVSASCEAASRTTPAPAASTATDAAMLPHETRAPHTVVKLECEIDDASPEVLAYAADRLREAGAREVHWLSVFCKKGRPAWQLQVVCAEADVERMQRIVFSETTTNGIRLQHMERACLERRFERAETPWGEVAIKVATLLDGTERAKPEFEDCAALAREHGIPLQQVMQAALAAYRAQ